MSVHAEVSDSDNRLGKWVTQARNRMAARREEKPLTKAGQIRALWREIEAALADGQSLKSVRDWLEDEGVVVTLRTLSSYKTRFRRREEANRKAQALDAFVNPTRRARKTLGPAAQETLPERPPVDPQRQNAHPPDREDPFAQARRSLEKQEFDIRSIHGDGDPTGSNLI